VISHPWIVELVDVYEDFKKIYIVTEYVDGGEMFDYLIDCKFVPEDEAALITY